MEIINADCRDVLREVVGGCENPVIVSDPPFNVGYGYDRYRDRLPDADYLSLMSHVFGMCPCAVVSYPESLYRIAAAIGKVPERVVSWVYNSNTARQHRDIAFFDIKPCFSKVRQPYKNQNDKRIRERIANGEVGAKLYDWWNVNQVKNVNRRKTSHPCQMPLEVMLNVVGVLPDDATVIDPFVGSGTTGVACKVLGREFVGIELSEDYCGIAEKRIARADEEFEQLKTEYIYTTVSKR